MSLAFGRENQPRGKQKSDLLNHKKLERASRKREGRDILFEGTVALLCSAYTGRHPVSVQARFGQGRFFFFKLKNSFFGTFLSLTVD